MREHKKQLHDKVLRRTSELHAMRELYATAEGDSAAAHAVDDALGALATLGIDWEVVDEMSAHAVMRWLDNAEALVVQARIVDRVDGIHRRLDAHWHLESFGVPAV